VRKGSVTAELNRPAVAYAQVSPAHCESLQVTATTTRTRVAAEVAVPQLMFAVEAAATGCQHAPT
jgi:hypothetical protein